MDETEDGRAPVVTGFDGSVQAEAALRYAIAEGARCARPVGVVVAHEPLDAWMSAYGLPLLADSGEIRRAVEDIARARVEEIRGEFSAAQRAVPVEVAAITGPAAFALTQQAQGAELLVVGHRGRGPLRSALLGSVGLSLVLRAPCPVTVVRPTCTDHHAMEDHATEDDVSIPAGPLVPIG